MSGLCLKFCNISVLKAKMQGEARGEESGTIKAKGSQYWQMYANYAKPHLSPFTLSVQIHAQVKNTSIDLYRREANSLLTQARLLTQSSHFLINNIDRFCRSRSISCIGLHANMPKVFIDL